MTDEERPGEAADPEAEPVDRSLPTATEPEAVAATGDESEPIIGSTAATGEQAVDEAGAEEPFRSKHPDALRLELAIHGVIIGVLTFIGLAVGTVLVLLVPASPLVYLATLALPGLLLFPLLVMPRWSHRRYRYRADDDGLEIRKGVWWRSHRFIPRSRLQHTDIAQGPLERRLGLANLVVHTAGTHEAKTTVSGLSLETARQVRDRLIGETESATDGV